MWSAVHVNDVVGPYQFYNETARGLNYFQVVDTYIRSEDQKFPQSAAFQQYGDPSLIKLALHFLLDGIVPNLWIGRCSPASWSAKLLD